MARVADDHGAVEDDGRNFSRSADYTPPTEQIAWEVQAASLNRPEVETPIGFARPERDGLHQIVVDADSHLFGFRKVPSSGRRAPHDVRLNG